MDYLKGILHNRFKEYNHMLVAARNKKRMKPADFIDHAEKDWLIEKKGILK
jgi:hypothetical protein